MKNIRLILVTAILVIGCAGSAFSRENVDQGGAGDRKANPGNGLAAGCTKSTNIVYMDLNNVRCPILMNGDMWWDAINNIARYEIPKGSGKTSLFAGAIWVGGLDVGGNLKLAAQTYRQSGVDFWPGPLDTVSITTDPTECLNYDRHWNLLRSDVQAFVNGTAKPTADMISWPGNGDPSRNEGHYLAPFHDSNGDGIYNVFDNDYPDFDLSTHPTCGHLYGDQNIWWVFNDEGNIHGETGGAPIGLEVRAQAFCFQTNDDINNCTFYNYQIINRSHNTVNDTWFGAWVDADLGYAYDDYVGCDVGRGMGYDYNGEAFDPGTFGYGFNPPAVGMVFFQGPIADPGDGIDNNRNGIIDEQGEDIIMSQFVYYTNDFSVQGNPLTATNYYNYLKGIWIDGTPITFGGSGHGGSVPCNFMFPGLTDPTNWGTAFGKTLTSGGAEAPIHGPAPPSSDWTEVTAGDVPGDRRFLESAGKFTLQAGAVNYITTGVPWARTTSGGPTASIPLLQRATDLAQALFNSCFAITNGPDAPDVNIRELNQEIILSIYPGKNSNDSIETNYAEKDPFIRTGNDTAYHFQGYQIYQFANSSVSITDVGNPDDVRLVAQCDIKDSVNNIVNYVFDPSITALVPVEEVVAANLGLQHTFDIKTDLFATGTSANLINHQTYYYCVIAYGYNASEVSVDPNNKVNGNNTPYIAGRRNVFTYTAVPHIPDPQDGGLLLNSNYGDAPMIQRMEGTGNGGLILDMTQASIYEALSSSNNYRSANPFYNSGSGPIDVTIYDPVAVGDHDFMVYLRDTTGNYGYAPGDTIPNSKWYITEAATGQTDSSDQTIAGSSEKIFPQWGISVNVQQVRMAGEQGAVNNGFLGATMTFTDSSKQWLTGISNVERDPSLNWIANDTFPNDTVYKDPTKVYEQVLNGTWAPFRLCSYGTYGPIYNMFAHNGTQPLDSLASVDIVLTSDQSVWSRSVVIEEDSFNTSQGGNYNKGNPRVHASVDKNGLTAAQSNNFNTDASSPNYINANGMGWFPGYAIDEETGERLNIMFGENSYFVGDNGADMQFDPSPNIFNQFGDPVLGGMHYIYIMGHGNTNSNYDACSHLISSLDSGVSSFLIKRNAWTACMWVGLPLLASGSTMLETPVKIRLRVAKSYRNYNVGNTYSAADTGRSGIPYYKFSTNGLAAETNQTNLAKNALDLINIVPNPYYAYSAYEINQLDNRVKIVNLPNNCTVTIFTSSGILVRTYVRNVPASTDLAAGQVLQSITNSNVSVETNIDWDLKNSAGVPVAGGVYIIHIQAPGLGERVIKWFGIIRPLDLQTF